MLQNYVCGISEFSIMMANAFENAINGCLKVPEDRKREIRQDPDMASEPAASWLMPRPTACFSEGKKEPFTAYSCRKTPQAPAAMFFHCVRGLCNS